MHPAELYQNKSKYRENAPDVSAERVTRVREQEYPYRGPLQPKADPSAGVGLLHLGEILKSHREAKGLSLKEVENTTSIRISYLQAIEEGQVGKLISPVYAHGFISKYATFLELDPERLLRDHPYVLKTLAEKSSFREDFTLGRGALEVRGSPGGEVKWLPNLMWVGLSLVGMVTLWFLARYLGLF